MSQYNEVDKLRINSRIKHLIICDYLPTWAGILSRWNPKLNYFDCFAGPGEYEYDGNRVDGSPIIAIKGACELLQSEWPNKPTRINFCFIENDPDQNKKLKAQIDILQGIPNELRIKVEEENSEKFIEDILSQGTELAPSFFFIDPYEHPYSLQLMNRIMGHDKAEIMVNFMYYQIIRDIPNSKKEKRCLKLFAPDNPETINFKSNGKFDEDKMLDYLHKRVDSKYYIPFRVYHGPDEKVGSGKLKYLLIHYSNDLKAFELMLNTMWKHGEPDKPLMVGDHLPILFPLMGVDDLKNKILHKYNETGDNYTFDAFKEKNWSWYYLEKHYRKALKELEKEGMISVNRKKSKTPKGLGGNDIMTFKGGEHA